MLAPTSEMAWVHLTLNLAITLLPPTVLWALSELGEDDEKNRDHYL
jgi:hypothetical protein